MKKKIKTYCLGKKNIFKYKNTRMKIASASPVCG